MEVRHRARPRSNSSQIRWISQSYEVLTGCLTSWIHFEVVTAYSPQEAQLAVRHAVPYQVRGRGGCVWRSFHAWETLSPLLIASTAVESIACQLPFSVAEATLNSSHTVPLSNW